MFEVEIAGVGHYLPDNIVKNDDIAKLVDTNDEWIVKRTGIRERRISRMENTSDLAQMAAEAAIKDSGIDPQDIELIIVATTSQDNFVPSTACVVQKRIGADRAFAFDIFAACSGFLYALNAGYQFIRNGTVKNALIIGSEVLSKVIDWSDKSTCVLMGDGAGAAVIRQGFRNGIVNIFCSSCGEEGELLRIPGIPLKNPYAEKSSFEGSFLKMNGSAVFQFATEKMSDSIDKILQEENLKIGDIKYIIPHQANLRIIDYAARKLGIPLDRFYVNLDKYGNTSSASIPIALSEMDTQGLLKEGDMIILVSFGGGLTYAGALVKWTRGASMA